MNPNHRSNPNPNRSHTQTQTQTQTGARPPRRTLHGWLATAALAVAVTLATAGTTASAEPSTGVAAIGFAAWADSDRATLASAFVEARGTLELAMLYHSFDRTDPMLEVEQFARTVVPKLSGTLVLRLYLDSGPNRRSDDYGASFRPSLRPAAFWKLAGGRPVDPEVQKFHADWATFIQPAAQSVAALARWSEQQRLAPRLRFEIVPVLEDDAGSNAAAWRRLLDTTRAAFLAAGAPAARTGFERNPNGNGTSRRIPGLGLEFHAAANSGLQSGDTLTADGVTLGSATITPAQWTSIQQAALRRGITALYWHPAFNGGPRTTRPDQRGELRPFEKISKAELVRLLRAR